MAAVGVNVSLKSSAIFEIKLILSHTHTHTRTWLMYMHYGTLLMNAWLHGFEW